MAVFRATMHQVAPHTWQFESPDVAPMKGHCRACKRDVAIRKPRVVDLSTGNYIVRGDCEDCRAEVTLILS